MDKMKGWRSLKKTTIPTAKQGQETPQSVSMETLQWEQRSREQLRDARAEAREWWMMMVKVGFVDESSTKPTLKTWVCRTLDTFIHRRDV